VAGKSETAHGAEGAGEEESGNLCGAEPQAITDGWNPGEPGGKT